MKRFSWRGMSRFSDAFKKSSTSERLFREELEQLFAESGLEIQINRASKYTENPKEYSGDERLHGSPTDYFIAYYGMTVATCEVTEGKKGWSWVMSAVLPVSENKLRRMDDCNAGFVIYYITKDEPHFVWADMKDIRKDKDTLKGDVWITKLETWHEGLESLAKKLIVMSKHWERSAPPASEDDVPEECT
jgi:hypothetical protein